MRQVVADVREVRALDAEPLDDGDGFAEAEVRRVRTPAQREWPTTTWFAGRSKLTVSGGTRIWGPWEDKAQVWEARLRARETRRVELKVAAAANEEGRRVAELTAGPDSPKRPQPGPGRAETGGR